MELTSGEALGIEAEVDEDLFSIWGKIKDKWASLSPCEQVHLVAGLVGCAAVGVASPVAGVGCGIGVWISSAANC